MPKLTAAEIKTNLEVQESVHSKLIEEINEFESIGSLDENGDAKRNELLAKWDETFREQGYSLIRGPESLEPEDMEKWVRENYALIRLAKSPAVVGYMFTRNDHGELVRYCKNAADLAEKWITYYVNPADRPEGMTDEAYADAFANDKENIELFGDVQNTYYEKFYAESSLWDNYLPRELEKPAAPKLNREQLNTAFERMGEPLYASTQAIDITGDNNPEMGSLMSDLRLLSPDLNDLINLIAEEQYVTHLLSLDMTDKYNLSTAYTFYPELGKIETYTNRQGLTDTVYSGELNGKTADDLYDRRMRQQEIIKAHLDGLIADECGKIERKYMKEHELTELTGNHKTEVLKLQRERTDRITTTLNQITRDYVEGRKEVPLFHTHERITKWGNERSTFGARWKKVFNAERRQEAVREQLYGVLKGPDSIEPQDMMLWYSENYQTLALLAVAFDNGAAVFDPETDKMLQDSVELAKNWQKQCCTVDLSNDVNPAQDLTVGRIGL